MGKDLFPDKVLLHLTGMKTGIHLSDHFTYSKLLRFTLPSIVMNIFSSLYIIVDGFFVANFAGKTEFAAVNLIMPVLNILGTIGYMFGVGGSALIAKRLGEKDQMQALSSFRLTMCSQRLHLQCSSGTISTLRSRCRRRRERHRLTLMLSDVIY